MRFLGANISIRNGFSVWFFSEATRYIPGNIWAFASRAYMAQSRGIHKKVAIVSLPMEITLVTVVASTFSTYAISENLPHLLSNIVFLLIVLTSVVTILGLLMLQKLIRRVLKRVLTLNLKAESIFPALGFQVVGWSFYSFGTFVLISHFNTEPNYLIVLSSIVLSWLVGYLSLVTPMGLGVRESAFILLLGSQIGVGQAFVIAVMSRVVLITSELVNLVFWVNRRKS